MDYKEQLIASIIEEVSILTHCLYFLLNLLVASQLAMVLTDGESLPFCSCDTFFYIPIFSRKAYKKNLLLER